MPSPFPGMNPYLERASVWTDFHASFLMGIRDAIARQVVPAYYVRIEQTLYVHEFANPFARGDVGIVERCGDVPARAGAATTLTAPVEVLIPVPQVDNEHIPYLEVWTRDGRRVVTVIELLNPTNKDSGPDRAAFMKKRLVLLNRAIHYVEIDLLRGGPRMPIPDMPPCDYNVLLSRFPRRPRAEFWPLRLRDPLPTIPIPLLAPDSDAIVDLQAVLHRIYDSAGYEPSIYDGPPEPALTAENSEWARSLVPSPRA